MRWFIANIGKIEFECHKWKTNFRKICIIPDRNNPLNPHAEVVCAGNSRGLIQTLVKNLCYSNISFEHMHTYVSALEEPTSVNALPTLHKPTSYRTKHKSSLMFILWLRKQFISYLEASILSASDWHRKDKMWRKEEPPKQLL